MKKNIIVVFGGSFNPPTLAHINLAKQITEKVIGVEKVIFVPVSTKYNKKGLAPDEDRYNMLKQVCERYNNLEVSSIELDSTRQLYTIETLSKIQNDNPEKEIYFMLGTDNLKEIETWHKAQELIATFKIFVLKRDNDNMQDIIQNNELLRKYKDSFIELKDIDPIKLSASYIREKIKNGEDVSRISSKRDTKRYN